MKLKDITLEQAKWIEANALIFKVNHRLTPDQLDEVYAIYNYVYSSNKKTTSCGRCLTGVLRDVWGHYQKMNIL